MINKLDSIMKNPVISSLDTRAEKLKRDFVFLSCVLLIIIYFKIEIPSEFRFPFIMGFEPKILRECFYWSLFGALFYKGIHLVWSLTEHYKHNRISLTGCELKHITAGIFGQEGADYPSDPKNSTIYHYLADHTRQVKHCLLVA